MYISGIKALYYDYETIYENGESKAYYTNRSEVTASDLMSFGKIANIGVIKLSKNIKSIVVVAVDNAGNTSEIITYTIDDEYLISE